MKRVRVNVREIPEYLHKSDLYKEAVSMMDEENEENNVIEVPKYPAKLPQKFASRESFFEFLDVLQYWMMYGGGGGDDGDDGVPMCVYAYCHEHSQEKTFLKELQRYAKEKQNAELNQICIWYANDREKYANLTLGHCKYLMKCVVRNLQQFVTDILSGGNLTCFKYIYTKKRKMMKTHFINHYWGYIVTCSGHVHILQYLYEQGHQLQVDELYDAAVTNGHVDCLKFLHEHGCI